jgi:hypothetical protein
MPRLHFKFGLEVLLTVHHGTLKNQHQLHTLVLVCLLGVNALHDSGVTRPSSGGSALMRFGVIKCVGGCGSTAICT